MTQEDIESVAQKIRAAGLHTSWIDLMILSKDAIGSIVDAFQGLLRNTFLLDSEALTSREETQRTALQSLNKALILLTSEAQLLRWKSEALAKK